MNEEEGFAIGDVAASAGVSVRTLHHYDAIGLVRPSGRTASGHRRYAATDVDRLARVLGYRELGLPLERIRAVLDDPATDEIAQLEEQRELLQGRVVRLSRIIAAIDTTLEAAMTGTTGLTPAEKLAVFGEFDPDEHVDEARSRWGDSPAWRSSRGRVARYTADDWTRITAEESAIRLAFATAMHDGRPADSDEATADAARARRHIDETYYACDHEFHRRLGDLYVADPRFAAGYEEVAGRLASYVRDAIHANADRSASDSATA